MNPTLADYILIARNWIAHNPGTNAIAIADQFNLALQDAYSAVDALVNAGEVSREFTPRGTKLTLCPSAQS